MAPVPEKAPRARIPRRATSDPACSGACIKPVGTAANPATAWPSISSSSERAMLAPRLGTVPPGTRTSFVLVEMALSSSFARVVGLSRSAASTTSTRFPGPPHRSVPPPKMPAAWGPAGWREVRARQRLADSSEGHVTRTVIPAACQAARAASMQAA